MWQPLALTFKLAALVAIVLFFVALPIAYWIAFTTRRWRFLVEATVGLPLVLPPTVLGFYLLIAFGPFSPLGRYYQQLTGQPLAFTFRGLVVGSVIYSLPFAVQPMAAGFSAVDRKLLAASATLGASRFQTFVRVILPLSIPALLTAVTLSFAHTVGEFGVVLMIGGNIPGVTQTISIAIYDQVQALDYASANSAAAILLMLSFVLLSVVYGVNRRIWTVLPSK